MTRNYLITVAILGIFFMVMIFLDIKVVNGALPASKMNLYHLATNVLMVHTVTLFGLAFMNRYLSRTNVKILYYLFTVGVVMFSVPIYLLATDEVTNIELGILKPVSLLGGLVLLLGWVMVLYTGFTYKHKKRAIHSEK